MCNLENLNAKVMLMRFPFFLQASHMQQNGMMSGGPPMHPGQMHGHGQPQPQASPLDSQGGHSPTSSNTSQTPQTTPTSSSQAQPPKTCGRPGCQNQVQRAPDGWQSDFCSNECVVGQCREVYTTWSSTSTPPSGPNPVGPAQHQAGVPQASQNYPQQQQPPTAVVK